METSHIDDKIAEGLNIRLGSQLEAAISRNLEVLGYGF